MKLDLTNDDLQKFLLKLQRTWRKNVNLLFEDDGPRPIDLSPTEASISRLIANQEQHDKDAFLREWAAFLGPGGHLATLGGTVAARQVANVVRSEAAIVSLPSVAEGIIEFDAPTVKVAQSQPAAPMSEIQSTAIIKGIQGFPQGETQAINEEVSTSDETAEDNTRSSKNGDPDTVEDNEGQNQDGGKEDVQVMVDGEDWNHLRTCLLSQRVVWRAGEC